MATATYIRWNLETAAREFQIHRSTLTKRLKAAFSQPGKDRRYSTRQICDAIYGTREGEQLRKLTAEADLMEMKRDEALELLIPSDRLTRVLSNVVVALRQVIKGSNLSHTEKDGTLRQIRELDVSTIIRQGTDSSDSDKS